MNYNRLFTMYPYIQNMSIYEFLNVYVHALAGHVLSYLDYGFLYNLCKFVLFPVTVYPCTRNSCKWATACITT